jgi:hypothetical protein
MYENESFMCPIQLFSNNKTPFTLGSHNILILGQNQVF